MGVVFAVVAFIVMLVVAGVGIVAGIIGILASRKMRKEGNTKGKIIKVISILVIIVSIAIALVPIVFAGIIICMNALPPSDFVKTGVVIEENGHQSERFTVNGVVYEALEYEGRNNGAVGTPVFEYRTKGFLNGSQRGNYYSVENSGNFNIVSDKHSRLFCPVDEKQKIMEFYSDLNKAVWWYELGIEDKEFTDEAGKEIIEIAKTIESNTLGEEITSEKMEIFSITAVSQDGIMILRHYNFVIIEGHLCYLLNTQEVETGIEYHTIKISKEDSQAVLREIGR